MQKNTALALLGGTTASVAKNLGCTRRAVQKWPNNRPLPREVADRVLAARCRNNALVMLAQGQQLDELTADAVKL